MFTLPKTIQHVAEDAYKKAVHYGEEAGSYLATQTAKLKKQTKRKEEPFMKKSTIIALIAFIAAAAGALAVAYYYLRRREAELDDFEDMLLYDDYYPEYAEEVELSEDEK